MTDGGSGHAVSCGRISLFQRDRAVSGCRSSWAIRVSLVRTLRAYWRLVRMEFGMVAKLSSGRSCQLPLRKLNRRCSIGSQRKQPLEWPRERRGGCTGHAAVRAAKSAGGSRLPPLSAK